ncbi:MAG: nuclear transport factor 2 family protein [Acidimicrobiales bacterium]
MTSTPTDSGSPDLAALADRHAIHDVILHYCRGIDRMDRGLVTQCFHEDAHDTHGSFRGSVGEFIEWAFALLDRYDSTMHLIANHLVTLNGDAAIAETYGIAYHRSSDPNPRLNLTVGFRYLDRFERRNNGPWRIARRIATTEWVTAPSTESVWPIPSDSAIGARDHSDPIFQLLDQLNSE